MQGVRAVTTPVYRPVNFLAGVHRGTPPYPRPMRPLLDDAPFPDDTTLSLDNEHLAAEVGGDFIIMSMRTDQYYGLEAVGAYVWRLLERPRSFSEVVSSVSERFAVDRVTAARDLSAFVRDLESEGLLELGPGGVADA